MKKLGLTGGIGVGKTYVSKVFQQMGIPVFNADVEAKNCMTEDKELMRNVKTSFGEDMYDNGVLQKEKLAEARWLANRLLIFKSLLKSKLILK